MQPLSKVFTAALVLLLFTAFVRCRPVETTASGATLPADAEQEKISLSYICPVCTNTVPVLLDKLEENSTASEIFEVLVDACKLLGNTSVKADCTNAAEEFVFSFLEGTLGIKYVLGKYSPIGICSILNICENECCQTPNQPEQIHLSVTGDKTEMAVSWVTLLNVSTVVEYGLQPNNFSHRVYGACHTYHSGGWKGVIHQATMTGLKPGTRYYYRVGDPHAQNLFFSNSWSVPSLYFDTEETTQSSPLQIAVIGDMGATDASLMTAERVIALRAADELDFVLHVGDISYADMDQRLWDEFMRLVEPVSAYVPYMVCPGNHEDFYDFAAYRNRYSLMPSVLSGSNSSEYYSFNYGHVHVVAINTEAPLQGLADFSAGSAQYQWLEEDLKTANLPENRAMRPWIILMGHRPFYCSVSSDRDSCIVAASYFKKCLEDLLNRYKVDLVITAHVHSYQRIYPVYKGERNTSAPVYIVNGAAGSKEQLDPGWEVPSPSWSAFNFTGYGYGIITVEDKQALTWQFFSSSDGSLIDSTTLVK